MWFERADGVWADDEISGADTPQGIHFHILCMQISIVLLHSLSTLLANSKKFLTNWNNHTSIEF